jgi:hypothetical protein
MIFYEGLIWLTGLLCFGSALIAYRWSKDVFHPVMFLGPMLSYTYFLSAIMLYRQGTVERYLPMEVMPFVQLYFLLGISALVLGAFQAGRPRKVQTAAIIPPDPLRDVLRKAGIILGVIGTLAFYYMLGKSGGFDRVYGVAHGGPWAASGYIRNLVFWVIPAIMLVFMANTGRTIIMKDRLIIAFFAAPILIHGLLSAARGPTFIILVTLGVGWFMIRLRRPPLAVFLIAGFAVGFLILLLVTHREHTHLGAGQFEFEGAGSVIGFASRENTSNEYIYGSGTVIAVTKEGSYQWGGRYIEKLLIRPIPRQLWPSQYEDFRNFWGMETERLDLTAGVLGWSARGGASTGLFAEVWGQLWVFGFPVLYLVGLWFGTAWRKAVSQGGVWIMIYVVMIALSIYLVQQTLQAFLWRLMFLAIAGALVWRIVVHPQWKAFYRRRRQRMRPRPSSSLPPASLGAK